VKKLILVLTLAAVAGCGGGGGETVVPPATTNLTPTTYEYRADGTFVDSSGNETKVFGRATALLDQQRVAQIKKGRIGLDLNQDQIYDFKVAFGSSFNQDSSGSIYYLGENLGTGYARNVLAPPQGILKLRKPVVVGAEWDVSPTYDGPPQTSAIHFKVVSQEEKVAGGTSYTCYRVTADWTQGPDKYHLTSWYTERFTLPVFVSLKVNDGQKVNMNLELLNQPSRSRDVTPPPPPPPPDTGEGAVPPALSWDDPNVTPLDALQQKAAEYVLTMLS